MRTEKRCDNCTFSTFTGGSARPTLICRQEKGHEGRWMTHALLEKCENFYPSRAADPDSSGPRLIPLTRGKFAVVDAEDYDELTRFIWYAEKGSRTYYATTRQNGKRVLMHRRLIEPPPPFVVDHIDRNGLNNRRSNLRLATEAQNARNKRGGRNKTSRYKGVYWRKERNKWGVKIAANHKTHSLGCFEDETEAAKAYDKAAKRLHGEFAVLNFGG